MNRSQACQVVNVEPRHVHHGTVWRLVHLVGGLLHYSGTIQQRCD